MRTLILSITASAMLLAACTQQAQSHARHTLGMYASYGTGVTTGTMTGANIAAKVKPGNDFIVRYAAAVR